VIFSSACQFVASCEAESNRDTSASFDRLSDISHQQNLLFKELAEEEISGFEEVIRDYVRQVSAVKIMLSNRHEIVTAYCAAQRSTIDKKERLKLATGTAIKKLQTEVPEAENIEKQRKEALDVISKSVRSEIERFEVGKAVSLKDAVTTLVRININFELRVNDLWKNFLGMLQNQKGEESK